MMAGQIGYWLLAVGYLHISTFYKKGATHEALCTNRWEMCKCAIIQYPISNIRYSMRADANWLLDRRILPIGEDVRNLNDSLEW